MNEFATPTGSMRGRIGRGAAWTAGGQMIRTATAIAQVLVLSHMLKPSDFGVVAMCAPILAFVTLVQDLGLTQAAMQKGAITDDDVPTAQSGAIVDYVIRRYGQGRNIEAR